MLEIENKNVTGIRLLSIKEALTLPEWILSSGRMWWWLRSKGRFKNYIAYVDGCSILSHGTNMLFYGAVRPALRIRKLDEKNLAIGETVRVFGRLAQYIGNNSVLKCVSIGYRRYDGKSNAYKTSEIKRHIEDWLTDQKAKKDQKQ